MICEEGFAIGLAPLLLVLNVAVLKFLVLLPQGCLEVFEVNEGVFLALNHLLVGPTV